MSRGGPQRYAKISSQAHFAPVLASRTTTPTISAKSPNETDEKSLARNLATFFADPLPRDAQLPEANRPRKSRPPPLGTGPTGCVSIRWVVSLSAIVVTHCWVGCLHSSFCWVPKRVPLAPASCWFAGRP